MQRKIYAFCLVLSMICCTSHLHAQQGKSEIVAGYGYYSEYAFYNHYNNGNLLNSSYGIPALIYRYYVTRNVTIGVGFGFEDIPSWGNFFTVAPELTFAYMDTRKAKVRVKLYGSIAYGISVFNNTTLQPGQTDNSGVLPTAFQFTPLGIRVGRQFAFFGEFGYGYRGMINAGLCARFPRKLGHKNHSAE